MYNGIYLEYTIHIYMTVVGGFLNKPPVEPQMGHSENNGTLKWMVKILENPIKMDDLGGKPTIVGNIQMGVFPKCLKIRGEWPQPLALLHCSFLLIAAMRSPTVRFVHLGGDSMTGGPSGNGVFTGVKRWMYRSAQPKKGPGAEISHPRV